MATDPRDNVFGRLARPRRELTPVGTPPAVPAPPAPTPAPPPTEPVPEETVPQSPKKKTARKGTRSESRKRSGSTSPKKTGDRTNYLGDGLYEHKGKKGKKLVAYVGADVHRAVKVAAADRGVTMSELVDGVMRAAGFGAATWAGDEP